MNEPATTRVVLGPSEDQPWATIEPTRDRWQPSGEDVNPASVPDALIRGLLDVASAAHIVTSDLYTLSFSPEAVKGLADGTVQQVVSEGGVRAWVVDSATNHIREHAFLNPAVFLQAASIVVGAWRVLAAVTLQRHLTAINRQLGDIQTSVEQIRTFLQQERLARTGGTLNYLRGVSDQLQVGDLGGRKYGVLTELESIDRQLQQDGRMCEMRLEAATRTLKAATAGTRTARKPSIQPHRHIATDQHLSTTGAPIDGMIERSPGSGATGSCLHARMGVICNPDRHHSA